MPPLSVFLLHPVERALQDDRRRELIDHLGAAFASLIGVNEHALGLGGRQAFVPKQNREWRQLIEVARQSAGRLGARALRSVEVSRQAEDEPRNFMFGGDGKQAGGVGRELCPADRLERRRYHTPHIGKGEAERLGSGIDADETAGCAHEVAKLLLVFRG